MLAFYTYYWLRAGNWEAYFGGGWTRRPASLENVLGAGFFFAPAVPAVVAATLTLVVMGALSYATFAGVERVSARWQPDAERRRHLVLTVAAFAAFTLLPVRRGPSLRLVPAPRGRRRWWCHWWRRCSWCGACGAGLTTSYRRSARKLLAAGRSRSRRGRARRSVPPSPGRTRKRASCSSTPTARPLAETLASGLVTVRELHLLDSVRDHLEVTPAEHERCCRSSAQPSAACSTPARAASAERQLQLAGYREALAAAVLRNASRRELEVIRADYGIGAESTRPPSPSCAARTAHCAVGWPPSWSASPSFAASLLALTPLEPVASAVEWPCTCCSRSRTGASTASCARWRCSATPPRSSAPPKALRRRQDGAAAGPRGAARGGTGGARRNPRSDRARPPAEGRRAGRTGGSRGDAARALDERRPLLRASAVLAMTELDDESFRPLLDAALAETGRAGARGGAERRPVVPLLRTPAAGAAEVHSGRHLVRRWPLAGRGLRHPRTLRQMLFLRRVPLFVDLDPADLHDFCDLAREEQIVPPAVLCAQASSTTRSTS